MEESIVGCQYDDGETAMAGTERNGGFHVIMIVNILDLVWCAFDPFVLMWL